MTIFKHLSQLNPIRMKSFIGLLILCFLLGSSQNSKAQSDEVDKSTILDLFIEGPIIENGNLLYIWGNDKGEMSKSVITGDSVNLQKALIKYCENFGYKNCRIVDQQESDENPSGEILENISDTKHYIILKGEERAYRLIEIASDTKGPAM